MSTLLELQTKLRQLTEDYHEQMLDLTRELSQAVEDAEGGQKQMNFKQLAKLGARRPLHNRWLEKAEDTLRNEYLIFLCAVAQSAPEMDEGWLLLQRIACGAGVSSLEALAAAAMCLEEGDMERFARQVGQDKGLRNSFLLDAMLLRLACPQPCPKTEELLVDLAALLECPAEELRFLGKLAAVVARQDGRAYLSMSFDLHRQGWPGFDYIQENAGILYTDDFSEAKKHGFQSVILHDCIINSSDIPSGKVEMVGCYLYKCRFNDPANVILTDCRANQCTFSFPARYYNGLYKVLEDSIYFSTKMQLNHSEMKDCEIKRPSTLTDKTRIRDFLKLNDTPSTGVKICKTN